MDALLGAHHRSGRKSSNIRDEHVKSLANAEVLLVRTDLPFGQKRWNDIPAIINALPANALTATFSRAWFWSKDPGAESPFLNSEQSELVGVPFNLIAPVRVITNGQILSACRTLWRIPTAAKYANSLLRIK